MNGNGYYEDVFVEDDIDEDIFDDLDIFEDDDMDFAEMFGEDDDFDVDDDAERRRRRRRRRRSRRRRSPRTGGRSRYSRPRPSSKYVTQTQLQTALERVRKDVKTNGTAIKKVNARVNTVNSRVDSQAGALKKEISERKKETANLKNNIQMATLLPLLTKKSLPATTAAITTGGITIPKDTKLAIEGDSLSTMLPILMLGDGLGGSGSGGDSSNMLLLALAVSGGL